VPLWGIQNGAHIAWKLGLLREYLRSDEKVLFDIASSWDFYMQFFGLNSSQG